MKSAFWKRLCTYHRLYLVFVSVCGGLLLLMIVTLPAQPAGSHESAITTINIVILSFGTAGGLVLYWVCSRTARKQLEGIE